MASTYIQLPPSEASAAGVESFNSRTGAVMPEAADYAGLYLSLDGSVPMAGNLNMAANRIDFDNYEVNIGGGDVHFYSSDGQSWSIGDKAGIANSFWIGIENGAFQCNAQPMNMGSQKILEVGDGVDPTDGVNLGQLDAAVSDLQDDIDLKVSAVTGTSPIVSSGGLTPAMSLDADALLESVLSLRNYMIIRDDWISGMAAGDLGWSASNVSVAAGTDANPSVVAISTTASSSGSGRIWGQSSLANLRFRGGRTIYETIVSLDALSDGTETYTLICGITSSASYTPNDGIFFRYTHSTNGGQWQGCTASGGVRTDVNSAITPVLWPTFVTLKWVLNEAGTSVEFFINNVSIGTSSTNIPANSVAVQFNWYILKSAGTTPRLTYLDGIYYVTKFSTPR